MIQATVKYLVEQGDEGIADGVLVSKDSRSLASALGGKAFETGKEGGKLEKCIVGNRLGGSNSTLTFLTVGMLVAFSFF